jgi:hypothetical protein
VALNMAPNNAPATIDKVAATAGRLFLRMLPPAIHIHPTKPTAGFRFPFPVELRRLVAWSDLASRIRSRRIPRRSPGANFGFERTPET